MNRRGGGGRGGPRRPRRQPPSASSSSSSSGPSARRGRAAGSSATPPSSGGAGGGMSLYAFFALVVVLASFGSTVMMAMMIHLRHGQELATAAIPRGGDGGDGKVRDTRRGGDTKEKIPPFEADPDLPWDEALSRSSRYLLPDDDDNRAAAVVHYLPVIPHRRRTPLDQVHNLTHFLTSRELPREEDRPLYLYNPTLLPLSSLSDELRRSIVGVGGGGGDAEAAYAATFRVSNFANCFGPGRGVPPTYRNYLGLALLDSELAIVGGTDVVIDLNENLMVKEGGGAKRRQRLEDCQLVGLGLGLVGDGKGQPGGEAEGKKKGALYVLCNSYLLPVSLRRNTGGEAEHGVAAGDHPVAAAERAPYLTFENTYGTGLTLSLLRPAVFLGKNRKNLHIFEATSDSASGGTTTTGKKTYLEIWPGGPHEVEESTTSATATPDSDPAFRPLTLPPPGKSAATAGAAAAEEEGEGTPSWSHKFPILSKLSHVLTPRDSGSACCVPVVLRRRSLLLGVSHRKTRRGLKDVPKYNYVSRLYAFERSPPFDVVARSDVFCLGFGPTATSQTHAGVGTGAGAGAGTGLGGAGHGVDGGGDDGNPNVDQGREYSLTLLDGGGVEHCPSIHFVSGIADKEKVGGGDGGDDDGNNNKVIVSYGVNDCYPRMVEIDKDRLVGMLRPAV